MINPFLRKLTVGKSLLFKFKRRIWGKPNWEKVVLGKATSGRRAVPPGIVPPDYWKNGTPQLPPSLPVLHTAQQTQHLASSCALASQILCSLKEFIKVGVTTDDIDREVHTQCVKAGAYPSPLNYRGFPRSVCTSVNNVACHGIPDDRPLASGDILNVDITVYKDGFHGDCSAMFLVGQVDDEGKRLCSVTREALEAAVDVCKPGQPVSIIGAVIEDIAERNGFTVIPCFVGHGIGSYFHGPPDIYHIRMFEEEDKTIMEEGMSFTIEPVLGEGSAEIEVLADGWTAVSVDDSRSAQWEHTVLITSDGALRLTTLPELL